MFTAWKKAKAVAKAGTVISLVLSLLQYKPYGVGVAIPDQLWADPYFIGFFHNIVLYWSRLEFKREPTLDELAEIFTRAVYDACGSEENAKTASLTLVDSVVQLDKAGIGSLMARASDFVRGAGDGLICVNLVAGNNTYDQHPRVQEAQRVHVALGLPPEGLAGSFLQLTIKQEFKERYTSC